MQKTADLRSDAIAAHIDIQFDKPTGKAIRPLHGVNSGPRNVSFVYDARAQFTQAGFPSVRLHDIEYPFGAGEYVDVPCIFKNFDADESSPENYNFALTDEYIRQTLSVGAKIVYRLGVSIEHAPVKRHTYPPKDFAKWARICEHIIRHYNEGWANGHCWNIEYWEIWNEPDAESTKTWAGTQAQFIEFYAVAARHLKSCFPHLKVGGCGFTGSHPHNVSAFLHAVAKKSPHVPLDFFSFHCYSCTPEKPLRLWRHFRDVLNEVGYTDTEMALNEWNYMGSWDKVNQPIYYPAMKDHRGACYYAAMLCAMQSMSDIATANYFEANVAKEFCGIFNVKEMRVSIRNGTTMTPTKGFYAFKAFGDLYRMGGEAALNCDTPVLYATAATGDCGDGTLIANQGLEPILLTVSFSGVKTDLAVRLTDPLRTNETVKLLPAGATELTLTLPAASFLYVGTVLADPTPTYEKDCYKSISTASPSSANDLFE